MPCCNCCGSVESVPPYLVELFKLHLCYLTKDEVKNLFKVSTKTIDRWNGNTSPTRDFPYPRDIEGFMRWSVLASQWISEHEQRDGSGERIAA
jgi:hypothetical protein